MNLSLILLATSHTVSSSGLSCGSVDIMASALRQSHRKILVSRVDSVEWRLELERVGNRLTAAKRSEGWRGRVQFMVAEGGVAELPEVGRLGTEVGGEGERVREGERRVQGGAEVESIRSEYTTAKVRTCVDAYMSCCC